MLSAAKQRALKKGIEFKITIDDIVIPATCPLLGIALVIGSGAIADNSPTLDRIRNGEGYTPGNVMVISYVANRCKSNLSPEALLLLATNLMKITMPEWLAQDKGFI
jgi:hypothetical protein